MTPVLALGRRALLRWLGGATLVALGVVRPGAAADGEAVAEAALARIGRRYLALVPADGDVAALRSALGMTGGADVIALGARLDAAVRRDFAQGDVLAIDAWILSRTELRAAALVALTAPATR